MNHTTTSAFDLLNRKVKVTDPANGVTTFLFDAQNNLVSLTDPDRNTTTFAYNLRNEQVQKMDPLNHVATMLYDLAGNLISTRDRDGRVTNYTYNNTNELTGKVWLDASGTTTDTFSYTFDARGNILTAANGSGTYTMAYDSLNRMTSEQEPFGLALTFSYDSADNRAQRQDSLGGTTTYSFDSLHHMTSQQFGGTGQTPLRFDMTYTPRDQLASVVRYSDLAGTQKVGSSSYTYNGDGMVTSITHLDSTTNVLASFTYGYDLADRLGFETNAGTVTSYAYDATNQLTTAGAATYSYDLNGNRTTTGYQTGPNNQLLSDGTWTYSYDNEGNLIKKSKGATAETWTYGYDNQNHMIWAQDRSTDGGVLQTSATYTYDAFGRRLEKDVWTAASATVTTTKFAYDGDAVWADLNGSNAVQTRYLWGQATDQLMASIAAGGAASWYLTDHLGSVRDITNAAGTVVDQIGYDAYGKVVSESNPAVAHRYGFTGREFDGETGLQYNRARYFDPATGRWTTEDPLGFGAKDQNFYRYVFNGPTSHLDPTGLAEYDSSACWGDSLLQWAIGTVLPGAATPSVLAKANPNAPVYIPPPKDFTYLELMEILDPTFKTNLEQAADDANWLFGQWELFVFAAMMSPIPRGLPPSLHKIACGVRAQGKFDATVGSMSEARQVIETAMPDAVELPPAVPGKPYPSPPPGVKKWWQFQPAEPEVGNPLPHIKYADWTAGKKGSGGSWGHIFFK